MAADGHRPVSEKYRKLSDIEMEDVFVNIGISPVIVGGDQISRLTKNYRNLRFTYCCPYRRSSFTGANEN
ncbi:hypothetical protein RyT2_24180 [Pseudolactococcus yaeyamensis]